MRVLRQTERWEELSIRRRGSAAAEVPVSTSESYTKKTIPPLNCQKNKTRKQHGSHVKIPAREFPFLLASYGLPDAKGVRTHTVVYCPGGSPQL